MRRVGRGFTQYLLIFKSILHFDVTILQSFASKQPYQNAFSVSGKRNEFQKEMNRTGLLPPKKLRVTRKERQALRVKKITIIEMGNCCHSRRGEEGKEQRVPDCLEV